MKEFNETADRERVRAIWEAISGYPLDTSTIISVPFHINIGQFSSIGKNVFINQSCLFLDMGTITIEDDVLIGPDVKLLTEEHPLKPSERHSLKVKPIVIKRNAWIGAGATILPGVTVGQNVPDNTVVAGMPAKVMKEIK
jgi:acetyltransferase-like isoleucine patch superfamily enzyme